ncbi:MAG: hypothetical protein SOI44_06900 [Lactimicrobium sp.]|uniref:MarR family winged helix-turn-helix transcriptional regulator n=1 Tax=Lactimicrobium sp. TaxID=2563780 RepID=UPI002F3514E7
MIEYNKVIHGVSACLNRLDEMYDGIGAKYGITYNTLMIYYIFSEEENVTQKTICDEMFLAKSTVHSIVLRMVQDGMLVFTDRKNGKEKILALTPDGALFMKGLMKTVRQKERGILDGLGEEGCMQLQALTGRALARMDQIALDNENER